MTKIKICGIRTMEDVALVNAALPDMIGFIFVPGRRRAISPEQAAALRAALDKRIKAVGVFWDAPLADILKTVKAGVIDIIQLHGGEDDDFIRTLRAQTGLPIIKAFDGTKEVADTEADFVLLDSPGGGTGRTFDWTKAVSTQKKLFIAGGLHAGNVQDVIDHFKPFAVDVSSGVETDGVKDARKVHEFVRAVRKGGA